MLQYLFYCVCIFSYFSIFLGLTGKSIRQRLQDPVLHLILHIRIIVSIPHICAHRLPTRENAAEWCIPV